MLGEQILLSTRRGPASNNCRALAEYAPSIFGHVPFLSPPVLMHGGLLCVAVRLSVLEKSQREKTH